MRKFTLVAALIAALGSASAAWAPVWAGAGWYQIEDSMGGLRMIAGPFSSDDACKSTLPTNDEDAYYDCRYLGAKPSGSDWWGPDYPGK